MITVDVDARGLSSKFRKLVDIGGTTMAEALPQEGRLLAVELVKYTQPFGMGKDAQEKGMGAIKRDYEKVYPSPNTEQGIDYIAERLSGKARPNDREKAKERVKRYLRSNDHAAIEEMARDMRVSFEYSRNADPSFHASRWSRGVLKSGVSQIVLNALSVERLIKKAQKLVGYAKGAWAECAQDLGGRRGIPGWIKRNAFGRVVNRSKDKRNPFVQLFNMLNYTSQVLSQTNKRLAIKDREKKLAARIQKILRSKTRGL